MRQFTVSDAARELSRKLGHAVQPRLISDLFYQRRLDDERCPIVGRCRLIPEDYLDQVGAELAGQLGQKAVSR